MKTVSVFFKNIETITWWLFGAGFLSRLLYVGYLYSLGGVAAMGGADHSQYQALATNIAMHHVFSLSATAPFIADALRTPGYPLFLALSFLLTGGFFLAALVQVFLGAFVPVMIRKIGMTIGLTSRTATIAAIVGLLDLNFLANTASIQTEGLFMPLFLFALLYALRALPHVSYRQASILGFLFGVLALIRPAFLYVGAGFFVVFALMHFSQIKKTIGVAVAGLLVLFITLSPWLVRNHQQFGAYSLSSIGPVNLYTRLAVSVLAVRDGVPPFWGEYKSALHSLVVEGKIPDLEYPEHESALYDVRYNTLFTNATLQVIQENPKAFLKLQANSVFAILTHDNTLNILQDMQIAPADAYPHFSVSLLFLTVPFTEFITKVGGAMNGWYVLPFIGRAFWLLVSLCSLVGATTLWRRSKGVSERHRLMVVLYTIISFILVTLPIALSIDARMRVPIEPLLLILASQGVVRLLAKRRHSARI